MENLFTLVLEYKEYLTLPAVASLLAFYFIYRGIKFVIKIILYILLASGLVLSGAYYLGII